MSTTTTALNGTIGQAQENLDRTMAGIKDGIATATAGFEQAQATVRDSMQKFMKTAEEMFAFGQGNIEAVVKSTQVLATGMQDMGQTLVATARANVDETVSTMKAMASAKSVKEAVDLQASLLRTTLEKAVTQTSQLTDHSVKLSEQVFAPIGTRLQAASEKFGRVA